MCVGRAVVAIAALKTINTTAVALGLNKSKKLVVNNPRELVRMYNHWTLCVKGLLITLTFFFCARAVTALSTEHNEPTGNIPMGNKVATGASSKTMTTATTVQQQQRQQCSYSEVESRLRGALWG